MATPPLDAIDLLQKEVDKLKARIIFLEQAFKEVSLRRKLRLGDGEALNGKIYENPSV